MQKTEGNGKGAGMQNAVDGLFNARLLNKIGFNWLWFVTSITGCFCIATVFLRYTTPEYLVTASLLVRDNSRGSDFGDGAVLETLGLRSAESSVDNEIEILKSRTLMESVASDLNLYVTYFVTGHLKTSEIYDKSPFTFRWLQAYDRSEKKFDNTFSLTFTSKETFRLTHDQQDYNGRFGIKIMLPQGVAVVAKTSFAPAAEKSYFFKINDKETIIEKYRNALAVTATNKTASLVNLTLTDRIPAKGKAILVRLVQNYLQGNMDDKTRTADSTLLFIDDNIKIVSEELNAIETQIQNFRTANSIIDKSEDARMLLGRYSEYSKEKDRVKTDLKILNSLLRFIQKHPDQLISASIILEEPSFTTLAAKYNDMQLVKTKTALVQSERHPFSKVLDLQLTQIQNKLIAGIDVKKQQLELTLSGLSASVSMTQAQINKIPAKERTFLKYARQQGINEDLYLFLLKKRVETSISRSSVLTNARIIDSPAFSPEPVRPRKQLVLLIAAITGFALPIGMLRLKSALNTKITSKTDITDCTSIPILGEIGHNMSGGIHINENGSRFLSEQFRVLRTNIQFISAVQKCQAILLTSSMGGEGKSFLAVNLALTLAMTGKKVILLEFDLRKPKIRSYLNLKEAGLSDYLISNSPWNEVVQPCGLMSHFDVITCGSLPPNPAEVLFMPEVSHLITALKETYDYVLFDSAPVGLVADSRLLSNHVDLTLYVIRQNFTFRHQLAIAQELKENVKLPCINLVINDVKEKAGYSYDYGYAQKNKNISFKNRTKDLLWRSRFT